MTDTTNIATALLYPGDMGAAVASLLRSRNLRVVTTLAGRNPETAARAAAADVEILPTLADVVRQSNVVISLVPPAAAEELAIAYAALAHTAPANAIYVDANSIGPDLTRAIGQRVESADVSYVDAAINGLARNLTRSATLFLAGPRAADVAKLFDGGMRVRVVGKEVGRASAMKMHLSGLSKGLCALFVESALVAARQGMLPQMVAAYEEIYPGVMAIVERMLPTYAHHAPRRAVEMRETEQTAKAAGVEPCVLTAVRELHEHLATALEDAADPDAASVESLIEQLNRQGLLSPADSLGGARGGPQEM